jgi:hypothetical protein
MKYPALRFEIGIQIHLQWIDSYWWQFQGDNEAKVLVL